MALRVLLADESVTIKKVFQIALQDYGVEVKSVHVGLDVVSVAKSFKPDIVFADVLLQKLNGYEVTKSLKATPELHQVPVVLIWSNFLELDEGKFNECGADDHLEKPFDTERLRQVVQKLVQKTASQKMSGHLTFPKMPDFVDERPPATASASAPESAPPAARDWNMDQFAALDAPDEFIQLDLESSPQNPSIGLAAEPDGEDGDAAWVQRSLSKFKLNPEALEPATEAKLNIPDEPIHVQVTAPTNLNPTIPPTTLRPISEAELQAMIRAEAIKMIEKVVWEVVPELATQIIERELKRVMQEPHEPA